MPQNIVFLYIHTFTNKKSSRVCVLCEACSRAGRQLTKLEKPFVPNLVLNVTKMFLCLQMPNAGIRKITNFLLFLLAGNEDGLK